jgi:hypothetical protein
VQQQAIVVVQRPETEVVQQQAIVVAQRPETEAARRQAIEAELARIRPPEAETFL